MIFYIQVFNEKGQQILGDGLGQGKEERYKNIKTFERYSLFNEKHTINNTYKKGYKIRLVQSMSNGKEALIKEYN